MRVSQVFKLTLFATILAFSFLPDFVVGKSGGGKIRKKDPRFGKGLKIKDTWRTPVYDGMFYHGLVVIPNEDGTYY